MNETPETNKIDQVEIPEKKWTEDITIPVPLSEFLKMKAKIQKLKNAEKKTSDLRWKAEFENIELKKNYEALKKDYQKLLGIEEERGKQE